MISKTKNQHITAYENIILSPGIDILIEIQEGITIKSTLQINISYCSVIGATLGIHNVKVSL